MSSSFTKFVTSHSLERPFCECVFVCKNDVEATATDAVAVCEEFFDPSTVHYHAI